MHTNQGMMVEGLPLKTTNWSRGTEDELVRELLDDESPFFLPLQKTTESKPSPANAQLINQLISTVYSGPTINDIENSLPTASRKEQSEETISQTRIPMLDRGLMSKTENNKYTLKLKFCDNGMADDGYKWRKYGQKSIKNSPYPRSYYRCTNPRCSAKKQVERSGEDEDTLIITYEGLHLHFAYPCFMLDNSDVSVNPPPLPVNKKPKVVLETESSNDQETQQSWEEAQELYGSTAPGLDPLDCCMQDQLGLEEVGPRPQGLLEDVVPFLIRNPLSSNNVSSSNSSSCSPYRSAPTSPASLSWSPKHWH